MDDVLCLTVSYAQHWFCRKCGWTAMSPDSMESWREAVFYSTDPCSKRGCKVREEHLHLSCPACLYATETPIPCYDYPTGEGMTVRHDLGCECQECPPPLDPDMASFAWGASRMGESKRKKNGEVTGKLVSLRGGDDEKEEAEQGEHILPQDGHAQVEETGGHSSSEGGKGSDGGRVVEDPPGQQGGPGQ